jgi:hypothetical protein
MGLTFAWLYPWGKNPRYPLDTGLDGTQSGSRQNDEEEKNHLRYRESNPDLQLDEEAALLQSGQQQATDFCWQALQAQAVSLKVSHRGVPASSPGHVI